VGIQAKTSDGKVLLDIINIREENGEEVIDVAQYGQVRTYSRDYLEKNHLYALIAYYEKITMRRSEPASTCKYSPKRSIYTHQPRPYSPHTPGSRRNSAPSNYGPIPARFSTRTMGR
jgi:hypothetical protein